MALVLAASLAVMGVAALVVAYRRQWHVRLRAQIRALPEHRREKEPV